MPPTITEKHPPLPLNILQWLAAEIPQVQKVDAKLEEELRRLVRAHPLLSYEYGEGHIFWRGRPRKDASEVHITVKEMMWPPIERVTLQRMNLAREPILYVGDNLPTVVAELSSAQTRFLQFAGLEIQPSKTMRFFVVGEIAAIRKHGRSFVTSDPERARVVARGIEVCSPDEAERLTMADQLLNDAISRRDFHGLGAVIANEVRRKLPDVEGVMYGSVRRSLRLNVAIQPQKIIDKCNIVAALKADSCQITNDNACVVDQIESAEGINSDGEFIWSGRIQKETRIECFEKAVPVADYETQKLPKYDVLGAH